VPALGGGQPRLGESVVLQEGRDGGVLFRRRDDDEARRGTARRALAPSDRPRVAGEHEAVAGRRAVVVDQPTTALCTTVSARLQSAAWASAAAAMCSLGHGLRTSTAVPRSTQPSTRRGTVI